MKLKVMMMNRRPFIIAKEGFKSIGIAFVVALVLNIIGLCFLSFIAFIVGLVLLYAYRDPERTVNNDESAFISICDGKVFHIETLKDSILVSVDIGLLDVSLIRAPHNCKIVDIQNQKGINLNPSNYKSKFLNDRVSFEFINGIESKIELISGNLNNNIELFYQNDSTLNRGDRVAFMLNGVVKIYLPTNVRLKVDIGDKLRAGESIIGFYNN
jgi:phosphatidylserine decarboxylase